MGESDTTVAVDTLDYAQFRERRSDPSVTVIDVLPAASYRLNHIPGAKNLPLAHVLDLATEALPDKDREIVLYCAGFT